MAASGIPWDWSAPYVPLLNSKNDLRAISNLPVGTHSFMPLPATTSINPQTHTLQQAYIAGARDALRLGAMPVFPGSLYGGTPKRVKKKS